MTQRNEAPSLLLRRGAAGTALRIGLGMAIGAATGALLGWTSGEDGAVGGAYLAMARWLRGNPDGLPHTYPMWGYPALLALLPRPVLLALQLLGGALASEAVWRRLAGWSGRQGLVLALQLACVPWWALCAGRWPMPWLALAAVAFVLSLERALVRRGQAWVWVAGAALAVAVQFRSEALLWPLGGAAALLVARRSRALRFPLPAAHRSTRSLRPLLPATLIGVVSLLPWALHYRAQTGHVSPGSSNGGMVAYISLGQLPNNPWGVVHSDELAAETLARLGHPGLDPTSDAANGIFLRLFERAVRDQPAAYLRKIAHNLRMAATGGLYVGAPPVSESAAQDLDVVRERWKLRLELTPNRTDIERHQRLGLWDTARIGPGAAMSLFWQALGVVLGGLFLWLFGIGLGLAWRQRPDEPLVPLLAGLTLVQVATVGLLQYQPRHLTPLAVWTAPFAVLAVAGIGARLRRRHRPAPPETPALG